VAQDHDLAIEYLALPEDGEAALMEVDVMIDLDKLASDIVGAIWDDYENEKIVTRSRWEEIVKKAAKPHVDKVVTPPGGFGVGAFTVVDHVYDRTLGDVIQRSVDPPVFRADDVGKWFRIDHPLLPDED
jgi:hypothetical protein